MPWVGEEVPAHIIFPTEGLEAIGETREILRHDSRRSVGRAMGNYLHMLSRRPRIQARGQGALLAGAGEMFAASGATTEHTHLTLRVGNRVYRIREAD